MAHHLRPSAPSYLPLPTTDRSRQQEPLPALLAFSPLPSLSFFSSSNYSITEYGYPVTTRSRCFMFQSLRRWPDPCALAASSAVPARTWDPASSFRVLPLAALALPGFSGAPSPDSPPKTRPAGWLVILALGPSHAPFRSLGEPVTQRLRAGFSHLQARLLPALGTWAYGYLDRA